MWKGVPLGQVTFTAEKKSVNAMLHRGLNIHSLRDGLCMDTVYAVLSPVLSIYWKHSHFLLTYVFITLMSLSCS